MHRAALQWRGPRRTWADVIHGLTLDSGALIAFEKGDERLRALLRHAVERGVALHVVPGVIAQTWRSAPRQARLASFLNSAEVQVPRFDALTARAVGQVCGTSGRADIVDVHVALDAGLNDHAVVTSDPKDIAKVDPTLVLILV